MSMATTEYDKTEPPLTVPQRTFIDCDNVPPINGADEFAACLATQNILMVRYHCKQLSTHDANELKYLETRINKYLHDNKGTPQFALEMLQDFG